MPHTNRAADYCPVVVEMDGDHLYGFLFEQLIQFERADFNLKYQASNNPGCDEPSPTRRKLSSACLRDLSESVGVRG